MGYEISGAWGARMARPDGEVIVFVGDGSYLMLNSDLYSSVLTGHKLIVVVCDNGGFAVIDRLQRGMGGASFGNQLDSSRVAELVRVDFAQHAAAHGLRDRDGHHHRRAGGRLSSGRARRCARPSSASARSPTRGRTAARSGRSACRRSATAEAVRAARARIDEGKRAQRAGW